MITKNAESNLQICKVRYVKIKSWTGNKWFQALRYEEDGEKCVVKGPVAKPRNVQEEKTFAVASTELHLSQGIPVICHGLPVSTHLNGKIADLRSWDRESECYKVHFEDKDLEPRLLRAKFLRILFKLPAEA